MSLCVVGIHMYVDYNYISKAYEQVLQNILQKISFVSWTLNFKIQEKLFQFVIFSKSIRSLPSLQKLGVIIIFNCNEGNRFFIDLFYRYWQLKVESSQSLLSLDLRANIPTTKFKITNVHIFWFRFTIICTISGNFS